MTFCTDTYTIDSKLIAEFVLERRSDLTEENIQKLQQSTPPSPPLVLTSLLTQVALTAHMGSPQCPELPRHNTLPKTHSGRQVRFFDDEPPKTLVFGSEMSQSTVTVIQVRCVTWIKPVMVL